MNQRAVGWAFVAGQVVLLVALVLLPGGDAWPTGSAVWTTGQVLVIAGLALIIVASLRLGTGLTPTPVPSQRGHLVTGGLYRYVRHPIYTGVLLIVVGLTVRSGSVVTLAVALEEDLHLLQFGFGVNVVKNTVALGFVLFLGC